MSCNLELCLKQNVHNRLEEEIKTILKNWEETPISCTQLDIRSLIKNCQSREPKTIMIPELLVR